MASLQNKQIDQTYAGLIKTNDEAALGATEKVIQDGAGNDSTLSMGTASASFTGTLDLSGATVTGDNNTTYDLASAQSGTDVDVTLTGSDATTDTVKLVAGTNITLTDDGSNNVTIDAAGGGGAAGLESGTGADSMQSAASLTTVAANASGADSIALGDGAAAGNQSTAIGNTATASSGSSIAIGNDAVASGGLNDGCIAIGKNVDALQNRSIVIAPNNGSVNSTGGIVIGAASIISSGADRHIAIGTGITTVSGSSDAISLGTDAQGNGQRSVAIGQNATATASEAIALGYNVTAATASTVSVKALETQTASTPTAGGIIMTDAGSTARRLNIDASGNLQIDSTPVGGGGGGDTNVYSVTGQSGMAGYFMYNDSAQANHYKTWVQTDGYGRSATSRQTDQADYAVIALADGETISKIALNVFTASAASTAEVAIYDLAQTTDGGLILYNRLATLGTIDTSTTGDKVITLGTPFTMPSGKLNNQVAFVVFPSDSTVQMSGWTQGIWNGAGGQLVGGTFYRPMALHVKPGVSEGTALPSLIGGPNGSIVDYSAETSNPLFFLYKN